MAGSSQLGGKGVDSHGWTSGLEILGTTVIFNVSINQISGR